MSYGVQEVAKEPRYRRVVDAWEAAGKPRNSQATWDLQLNDNLQMPGNSQPKMRLDR